MRRVISTSCASPFATNYQGVRALLARADRADAPNWGACPWAPPKAGAGRADPDVCRLATMAERNPLDELRERIGEALRGSPAMDVEKNLQALLAAFFDRVDLAAREDLDVQKKLLERAQAKLAALEARVTEL